MKRLNLKGVITYEFQDSIKALGIFFLVLFLVGLINILLPVFMGAANTAGSFGGIEFSAWIYVFVVGIVSIRQDVRLFLQNGRGRLTVYLSQVFVCFLCAAVLCLGAPLLNALLKLTARLIAPSMTFYSSFEFLFANQGASAGVWQSMAYNLLLCVPAYFLGMFISLMYYRLNKLGKVLVSIAVPAVLFIGLPIALASNRAFFNAFVGIMKAFIGAFNSLLSLSAVVSLLVTIIFAIGSWLLLRRAPVK